MNQAAPRPEQTTTAPQEFRDALAELVQVGLRVSRMVGVVADAETALAVAASQAGAAEGVSALAGSLAEAIEADRAAAAAAEMRQTVVARAQAVAAAYARVSRAIRLTVMMAERLDRGWARRGQADDRQAMVRRQMARKVTDAIGRETEGEQTGPFAERPEALDTEAGIGNRPADEVIAEICSALGLDPVRMILRSPLPDAISVPEANGAPPLPGGAWDWQPPPAQPHPNGQPQRRTPPPHHARCADDDDPLAVGPGRPPWPPPQ